MTLEILQTDIERCLREYGVLQPVKTWKILADGPDHPVPYDVIRKICFAELENGDKYVVKFVREPVFPTEIIEHQSAFSDLLKSRGIDTPLRLKKDGHYCIAYEKDGLTMDAMAEEWMGEKIPHLTLALYEQVGRVLGQIHRISLDTGMKIGFSLLYHEITQRDTSYERLWRGLDHAFIPADFYQKLLALYDRRLAAVKDVWTSLPRAAVQGDVYSCNNIALRNGQLAVYDFNLAGDEVLLGDLLQCWFRTVFDEKIQEDLDCMDPREMWSVFMAAYQENRTLTALERAHIADIYAILGVVYFTKLLAFYVVTGRQAEAEKRYPFLLELLETEALTL